MLFVKSYTCRTSQKTTYSVDSFHNNKYRHFGLFNEVAFLSLLKSKNVKSYHVTNVKTKQDLQPTIKEYVK